MSTDTDTDTDTDWPGSDAYLASVLLQAREQTTGAMHLMLDRALSSLHSAIEFLFMSLVMI